MEFVISEGGFIFFIWILVFFLWGNSFVLVVFRGWECFFEFYLYWIYEGGFFVLLLFMLLRWFLMDLGLFMVMRFLFFIVFVKEVEVVLEFFYILVLILGLRYIIFCCFSGVWFGKIVLLFYKLKVFVILIDFLLDWN